jgi:hypothetical protein
MQTTPEILLGAYIAIAAEDAQPPPAVTVTLGNFYSCIHRIVQGR